jgi:membrane-bound lytic murein transglycosylase D
MQLILRISKFVTLAVLSCVLLVAWYDINTDILVSRSSIPVIENETSTTEATDSIWSSLSGEFKLDHKVQSSQVQAKIRELLADRAKLKQIFTAAGPYIYFIHQQTQARALPAELALIPVIESEFNPRDHSKKGALGLWQLMKGTAHDLGVKIKGGYDGRQNVIASTKAALAYFKDLGVMFHGNWYLAIAAYNCGQGKLGSAMRHKKTQNVWNLSVPKETKDYVAELLAVAAIVENPKKYGLELPHINNEPYFTELKVKKPVNLTQLAKTSGTNIQVLRNLNPDYKHEIIPMQPAYHLLVPINKVPAIMAKLADSLDLI